MVIKEDSDNDNENEGKFKKEISIIIAGGFLFFLGILLKPVGFQEKIIYFAAYLIVGAKVLADAVRGFFKGNIFGEDLLMSIATIGAFLIGEFPEAVAVMLFYRVGEYFQDKAVDSSRRSVRALMDIKPDYAGLKTPEGIIKVSPEEVKEGDIISVKPGEKIPLDGEIIRGSTHADTSALTGESYPKELNEGDKALSGMINGEGLIEVKVTSIYAESTVSRIMNLVESASERKAKTENFITKFARIYTPLVVIAAFLLAVIPPLITGGEFNTWIYRALVFLVVSCPCALVLSIPLGFFAGIGASSKSGVLVKGSNYLEALKDVSTVVFDKTGTLTEGKFSVTEINPLNGITREELLSTAAAAEKYSNHPIARSILKVYSQEVNGAEPEIIKDAFGIKTDNHLEIKGKGIKTTFNGRQVTVGNASLMKEEGIDYIPVSGDGTAIYVAADGQFLGSIVIADEIRKGSAKAISDLRRLGIIKIIMLTGDRKETAEKTGEILRTDEVKYELLPEDKVRELEEIQKDNKCKTLFLGDGINDAPVIARADIGAAMGGLGSDAAIEAADIVILSDDISGLVKVKMIADKTRRVIVQNIVLALGIKGIILILGALGMANMWMAVFADIGVALIAVLNSIRILNIKNLS